MVDIDTPLEGNPPASIKLQSISKSFGSVQANRDINLDVEKATIHGIIGENGAGKSTLLSILYGFYEADHGDIFVNGKLTKIRNSAHAIAAGIGMVHQHFMLVDNFTALENIMLGAESGALLSESIVKTRDELDHLKKTYGLSVDLEKPVSDLPVGDLQRVEILKALYRGAEVLILDEPTGVLTPQETDQLFEILKSLKSQGVTVLLITHKLREIMDITDAVSVMRQGKMVAHRQTAKTSKEELAELMVGRKVRLNIEKSAAKAGDIALEVNNLVVHDSHDIARLNDVSFNLKHGEIVGIAGVSGNGQSELLACLSGIMPVEEGNFIIQGRRVDPLHPCPPDEMRSLSVAHVPEDRHRMGMIGKFDTWETAILGYQRNDQYNNGVLADGTAIESDTAHMMANFDVRPADIHLKSANFSGGNQQKLILSREMGKNPVTLLVGQPTRGVDIGAIEFIHQQLVAMRDAGAAVLMVSVELEEVMSLSDRILVMCEGRIVGEVSGTDADARTLGLMMADAQSKEVKTQGKE